MHAARPRLPYFYLFMSLLIAAVVIYGFGQTIDHNLIHPSPLPPWVLYLHAPVFCGWVVFFILQSTLVRTRNLRVHKTLGWFGAALGALMMVLGYVTATSMDRFHNGLEPDPRNLSFLAVQLSDLAGFAVPFVLAILWRKKPEFHRRLMLVATCSLTDAAFGRFPWLPLVWSPAGLDCLILLGVIRDLIVDRRVHKVYLYALPALMVTQATAMYLFTHYPDWWVKIAGALVR